MPPNEKIFINDVLSGAEYKRFLVLKGIAKDLGYKYIWRRAGKFFIRGDKDRHLSAISGAYQRGKEIPAAASEIDPS